MHAANWALLACCVVLLFAGPAMALQELVQAEEDRATRAVTGEAPAFDAPFRATWRGVLLLVVIAGGIAGFLVSVRIARQPKVRSVSGRLLGLLLTGLTLLDLAFLVDGKWFLTVDYTQRAATIVWLYPLSAILMGGATLRLLEVERAFGDRE